MTFDNYFAREFKDYQSNKAMYLAQGNCSPEATCYENGVLSMKKVQSFLTRSLPIGITPMRKFVPYIVVKNVSEPCFSALNDEVVILQPRIEYSKRTYLRDGTFLTDTSGKVVLTNIDIPQQSRVIATRENIRLKSKVDGRAVSTSDGYGYLDVSTVDGRQMYLYYLPRENLYTFNLASLLITPVRLRTRYFVGKQYKLAFGLSDVYIYIVPYTQNLFTEGNLVLGLRTSCDFREVISQIENQWAKIGLTYPKKMTTLHNDMVNTDLGYSKLEPRIPVDFKTGSVSLADKDYKV